jgi:hypothetical protein
VSPSSWWPSEQGPSWQWIGTSAEPETKLKNKIKFEIEICCLPELRNRWKKIKRKRKRTKSNIYFRIGIVFKKIIPIYLAEDFGHGDHLRGDRVLDAEALLDGGVDVAVVVGDRDEHEVRAFLKDLKKNKQFFNASF